MERGCRRNAVARRIPRPPTAFDPPKSGTGPVPPIPAEEVTMRCLWLTASVLFCTTTFVANSSLASAADGLDWPQFRGPDGQGHADSADVPLVWSETENIKWKIPVPGLGWSSPAIAGEQIWLTAGTDEGHSLWAVCYDRDSGQLLHEVELFPSEERRKVNKKNSFASPTPILEGDRVYVHFGAYGTACLSTDGRIVWQTNEIKYDHRHGPGGSPALFDDLLIISCDGYEDQFVVALDKNTGAIRWRKPREGRHSYSTPLVIEVDGKPQAISTGGDEVVAYEPATGERIWWSRYDGYSLIPRPVYGHGMVFICSGYNTPLVYAIRPDGHGDVTDTHVVWSEVRGAPHSSSPILVGDELYYVSDIGIATCADALTGEFHWQHRLGGGFSASPISASGRIYFLNEEGTATVIEPGTEYHELAKNQVDGRTLASLAVSGRALFLRTDTHLYRIEEP